VNVTVPDVFALVLNSFKIEARERTKPDWFESTLELNSKYRPVDALPSKPHDAKNRALPSAVFFASSMADCASTDVKPFVELSNGVSRES
jgi:hypothetical protein